MNQEEAKDQASSIPPKPQKQTAIYVTGLPDDTTIDELFEHFSKVGVIMDDMFTGGPRIKLYENEDGTLKGDALVVYLCEPSVQLAIDILDESQLRLGVTIRVQRPTFKHSDEEQAKTGSAAAGEKKKIDKALWEKQMRHMKRKLDWTEDGRDPDFDSDEERERIKLAKFAKIVVLKHMFTNSELEADPKAFLDIKEDVLLEAEKFGQVTSVYLIEDSEDGKCCVKFKSAASAAKCLNAFNGRYFGGQRIAAEVYDGSFKIRETKHTADEPDEEERLENFGDWLDKQELDSDNDGNGD